MSSGPKKWKEKRVALRKDVRLPARIVDGNGSDVCQCMIVNISATGAKLILESPTKVADSFCIILSLNGKVRRNCEVAWRSGNAVGVRFGSSEAVEQKAVFYVNDMLACLSSDKLG